MTNSQIIEKFANNNNLLKKQLKIGSKKSLKGVIALLATMANIAMLAIVEGYISSSKFR